MMMSRENNRKAALAHEERCEMFGLEMKYEPVRRIDYVKGVVGYCAFGGLEGYDRHLATPSLVVRNIECQRGEFGR